MWSSYLRLHHGQVEAKEMFSRWLSLLYDTTLTFTGLGQLRGAETIAHPATGKLDGDSAKLAGWPRSVDGAPYRAPRGKCITAGERLGQQSYRLHIPTGQLPSWRKCSDIKPFVERPYQRTTGPR